MGKIGQAVRLVSSLPAMAEGEEILVWCPFLAGLDPKLGMWLGPLAWHDCNGALLAALENEAVPAGATVFAGVFCTDPFRSEADVLEKLRAAGVTGVVNLPSVSFLDGEFGQTLAAMNLGIERELAFLRRARSAGMRVAGCGSAGDVDALCHAGAELIIVHYDPTGPAEKEPTPRAKGRAGRLDLGGVRCVALSELLKSAGAYSAALTSSQGSCAS